MNHYEQSRSGVIAARKSENTSIDVMGEGVSCLICHIAINFYSPYSSSSSSSFAVFIHIHVAVRQLKGAKPYFNDVFSTEFAAYISSPGISHTANQIQ